MRLAGIGDTDIKLDRDGQPIADNNGNCILVAGLSCWMQDIWMEMLTEEGELLHEDEEGREAYGYSLLDFLNGEYDETLREEVRQQITEKLTKRSYIDDGSIGIAFEEPDALGCWGIHLEFREIDTENNLDIDIYTNGMEVYVT